MATDILITMQEDLQRALAKPAEERRWAMLVDLRKCVGCHGCTVACVSENKLPPRVVYRPVQERERGAFPKVTRSFLPRPCMHCDKPACVPVCPVPGKATCKETKGVAAGSVSIDYDRCIGCGRCVPACPYGARTLDRGGYHSEGTPERMRYETMAAWEYGKSRMREGASPPIGKARKCHLCVHRLAEGMLPQCVTSCIGRAGYFGDERDPKSLVAQVKKANQAQLQVLNAKAGTLPRVLYVTNAKLEVLHG